MSTKPKRHRLVVRDRVDGLIVAYVTARGRIKAAERRALERLARAAYRMMRDRKP